MRLRFGGMSPIIAEVPVRSSPPLPNAIPAELTPPEVRCDWFVVCGRYANLEDEAFFGPGDFLELSESGVAFMDMRKSHPVNMRDRYSWCNNPAGSWSAERIPLSAGDSREIHRIVISTCHDIIEPLRCTVEISGLDNPLREHQLVCDTGVTWVLCEVTGEGSSICSSTLASPILG